MESAGMQQCSVPWLCLWERCEGTGKPVVLGLSVMWLFVATAGWLHTLVMPFAQRNTRSVKGFRDHLLSYHFIAVSE